jgi:N-dimethylarginine dimethylaminohydrolase
MAEQPNLPEVPIDQSEKIPVKLPSQLQRPVVLMCPPLSVSAGTPNNIFMEDMPEEGRVFNRDKAMSQFLQVYSFISSMALTYVLPSKEDLQDIPYVANIGVVLPHYSNKTVVLANFASRPRRGETQVGKEFFEQLGYRTILPPEHFEGEADLKYLGGNRYAGAWGSRTSSSALVWFERETGIEVIPIHLTDEAFYHLDCAVMPISEERCIVAVDNLDAVDVKALEAVTEIIPVPSRVAKQGITNCVRINRVVMCGTQFEGWSPDDDQWMAEKEKIAILESICAKYGYEPVFFDISEFAKSGAALSCLVMKLNYNEMSKQEI